VGLGWREGGRKQEGGKKESSRDKEVGNLVRRGGATATFGRDTGPLPNRCAGTANGNEDRAQRLYLSGFPMGQKKPGPQSCSR